MKKQTKLALLVLWFVLCALGYYTAVHFEFGPIVIIYGAMSIVFGVGFFLVNGGIRSTVKTSPENVQDTSSRKQKKRDRYKKENLSAQSIEEEPRDNIFRLSPEKQKFYAELLLILFLPPTAVLVADYVLIAFLPGYY